MIDENVLVYQQFSAPGSPNPPFEATVEGATTYMWKIKFRDLEGTLIRRMVNKGCCSTKPVHSDKPKRVKLTNFKNPYKEA